MFTIYLPYIDNTDEISLYIPETTDEMEVCYLDGVLDNDDCEELTGTKDPVELRFIIDNTQILEISFDKYFLKKSDSYDEAIFGTYVSRAFVEALIHNIHASRDRQHDIESDDPHLTYIIENLIKIGLCEVRYIIGGGNKINDTSSSTALVSGGEPNERDYLFIMIFKECAE